MPRYILEISEGIPRRFLGAGPGISLEVRDYTITDDDKDLPIDSQGRRYYPYLMQGGKDD